MKSKLNMSMKILAMIKKLSNYYGNANKLVVGKMKGATAGAAIEEFFGLKPKMYSYLVNDNTEHKKGKGVNRNVVATIIHNEYKDILLKKKCLGHSMKRLQSKDHRIGTYEINKILSCFDDKIYNQSNGCYRLVISITTKKSFFVKQIVLISRLIRTAFLSRILNLKNTK